MLYNPKWNQPTLANALAFFESKPKDETYNWFDHTRCACGQLAKATRMEGWPKEEVPRNTVLSQEWHRLNELANQGAWTFGALADRVRRAMEYSK